ncbi:MAG: PAS domain S-box protein [Syntrophobacteraceae bacterium]
MSKPSDRRDDWSALRQRIIGLGERSIQKSYYPELQRRLAQLERFRALLDQSNDLIFLLEHPSGRLVDISEAATRRLDLSFEELRDTGLLPLLAPQVRASVSAYLNDPDSTDGSLLMITADLGTKRGDVFTVEMSIRRVKFAEGDYSVIVARDVTDRMKAESALRDSEEKYRVVVDNANEAIFVLQDEVIKFPNPSTCSILGYSPSELASIPFLDHVYPADRARVKDVHPHGANRLDPAANLSFRMIDANGQLHWLLLNRVDIRWEDRSATLCILHDITEQKKLEESLAHSQKMEAIGTLAGGIAHDFNNLLQIIHGFSELELMSPSHSPQSTMALNQIREAAARGRDLTGRLLAFGRKLESKRQILDLNGLLENMRMMLERTIPKMIRIELRLAPAPQCIQADPTQIEQVIMNLALNARDAMPEGGLITLETEPLSLDASQASTYIPLDAGGYARLRVIDTGEGMSEETKAHIFDPFFTTKEIGRGTGLGLAMVYGIVRQHGGAVFCNSELGHGTTFDVLLPRVTAGEESKPRATAPEPPSGSGTILLVDDEPSLLDMGEQILSRNGYKVYRAPDGEGALQLVRECGQEIDMVILDLIMPGMGGARCLSELLLIRPGIQVLIVSGYAQDKPVEELLMLGACGFLAKPYRMSELLEAVREAMPSRAAQSSSA